MIISGKNLDKRTWTALLDYCDFHVKINNNCCLGHFATTNPYANIPETSSELRNVYVYKCKYNIFGAT